LTLRAGEHIGGGTPPAVDIAVDPLDGTTLTAQGRSGAIAVSTLAFKGASCTCMCLHACSVIALGTGARHPVDWGAVAAAVSADSLDVYHFFKLYIQLQVNCILVAKWYTLHLGLGRKCLLAQAMYLPPFQ
jgi:hypothetical protein